jgi:hypothetical protein
LTRFFFLHSEQQWNNTDVKRQRGKIASGEQIERGREAQGEEDGGQASGVL